MSGEYNPELAAERHQAVLAAIGDLKGDIAGTHERLDDLNGRTRAVETKVAVLEERSPSKQGGLWGSIGGLLAGFGAGFLR